MVEAAMEDYIDKETYKFGEHIEVAYKGYIKRAVFFSYDLSKKAPCKVLIEDVGMRHVKEHQIIPCCHSFV